MCGCGAVRRMSGCRMVMVVSDLKEGGERVCGGDVVW